jgi:hypothetical protein
MTGRFPGHALDTNMDEEYDPSSYEWRGPYLAPEELADVYAQSEEQWEIEIQAQSEGWDSYPDWQPEPEQEEYEYIPGSRPKNDVKWDEANHVYLGPAAMAWLEILDKIRFRRNYNPPKKRMSTTVTVPILDKEVPAQDVPAKPKYVIVEKGRGVLHKAKRIPPRELPLYIYRGWKEVQQ